MNLLKILILIFLTVLNNTVRCSRCDKLFSTYVGPKSNNGKYILEIEGKTDKYVPNEKYEVTLKVDFYVYFGSKFAQFILTLESRPNIDDEDVTQQTGNFELGTDSLSKFSYICPNTVIEANPQPKNEIILNWVAPPSNSGCVTIRATVIETKEKWYADEELVNDGYLTKTLCEDKDENEDVLPEILETCCACDEAKYELAFQGNWIRNNHPKNFPEDLFTTKFSDIIGASHKNDQEFWNKGIEPSAGLKELAFNASTKSLESEFMDNISNLHTIIKARGLSYPNITASSYAIFRVDNKNHLVSLVAKIIPSPDWIVGVSSFELCLSNCSWKEFRTINLYPYDVGINDALEYNGNEPSAEPNPTISVINSAEPADSRSPFYDETGESNMKPIAMLHFKLQKIYKKNCDTAEETELQNKKENDNNDNVEKTENNADTDESRNNNVPVWSSRRKSFDKCKTVGWSEWSNCSAHCGKGHRTRNVKFKKIPPSLGECENISTEETQECDEATCEDEQKKPILCEDTIWTPWSSCSVTCGKGLKQRSRIFDALMVKNDDLNDDSDTACINKEVVECVEHCETEE